MKRNRPANGETRVLDCWLTHIIMGICGDDRYSWPSRHSGLPDIQQRLAQASRIGVPGR
jgi:hypothetical protein